MYICTFKVNRSQAVIGRGISRILLQRLSSWHIAFQVHSSLYFPLGLPFVTGTGPWQQSQHRFFLCVFTNEVISSHVAKLTALDWSDLLETRTKRKEPLTSYLFIDINKNHCVSPGTSNGDYLFIENKDHCDVFRSTLNYLDISLQRVFPP